VRRDPTQGIHVKDATEIYVNNSYEMFEVMQAGSKNRSIASTRMNARSSRSHSLFVCTVFQKNTKTDNTKLGKLYCIDLAGSEKTMKTNATGQTLEEAKMINKSLSALGNVINALTDTKKSKHVPYRDSKLTQILQESIGGNSLTCLVVTCSLSAYNDRETLSTLRFGNRAKSIRNTPIANAQRSAKELLVELNKTNAKIDKLNEVIRAVQKDIKGYFDAESGPDKDKLASVKSELLRIACAKDIDIIYAMFKDDIDVDKLEDNKEHDEADDAVQDNTADDTISHSKAHLTQSSLDDSANSSTASSLASPNLQDPAQLAQIQENAMKVFKQHLEIVKLKEELEAALREKEELEEEVSSRSKEVYEMNERLILMEMNHATARQQDLTTIQELRDALDKQSKLDRTNYRFAKFKDCLERLRCDLELLKLSEKFAKNRNKQHFDESEPKQDEAFLGDSLTDAKNAKSANDSSGSIRNASSDRLVLDNIQRSIDLIAAIQADMAEQDAAGEAPRKAPKKTEHDSENTTTIMQDIDIISGAVGEHVVASHEDSFLDSMCSDVNVSKFDENTVKYSVSASILEEKENRIRELLQAIDNQNKTIVKLTKSHNELKFEKHRLQKSLEDRDDDSPRGRKDSKSSSSGDDDAKPPKDASKADAEVQRLAARIVQMERDFQSERDHHLEIINNDTLKLDYFKLEANFKELKDAKDTVYKELVHCRSKVDKQDEELRAKSQTISELEGQIATLESTARKANNQLSNLMNTMPMQFMGPLQGGYVFPENMNGQLHFSSYGNLNTSFGGNSQIINNDGVPSNNHLVDPQGKQNPPQSFFAKNVVKPIKGGGKKRAVQQFDPNPYTSSTLTNDKEFENVARKVAHKKDKAEKLFHKPLPAINPFTPLMRPTDGQDTDSGAKLKTIKQIRRESKKYNYMNGFKQAQKQLLDESLQIDAADESINIDPGSDSDDEDSNEDHISKRLSEVHKGENQSIFAQNQLNSMNSIHMGLPNKSANIMPNRDMADRITNSKQKETAKEPEKQNLFAKKKTGFASTLSKAFKNLF